MRAVGLFLAALIAAASTLSADESYAIRLVRPRHIGDRYRLDAQGSRRERQRITVAGQPAENDEKEIAVHLLAVATVLKVDAKSSPTRIEYRIESCKKSSSGKTEDVLPPDRKVIVESKNGETVFTADGDRPLDAETQEALSVVISSHAPDSPTDEDIFGTRERKRVGDRWGINAVAAARDLTKKGIPVSPTDLKGSVQLDRLRTVDGVKALEIKAHLRMEGAKTPAPEGITIEKSVMEADFTTLVPADPQSRALLPDKLKIQLNIVMGGKKPGTDEKIGIELLTEMTLENSYSLLQADPKKRSSLNPPAELRSSGRTPAAPPRSAEQR